MVHITVEGREVWTGRGTVVDMSKIVTKHYQRLFAYEVMGLALCVGYSNLYF